MSLPVAAGLAVVGVACLLLAGLVWGQRRETAPAGALAVLLLAMAEWNLAYSLYWADAPAPNEHFWLLATYLGVVVAPTAVLVFAAQFAGRDGWLRAPARLALTVEPVLVLAIVWLDPGGQLDLVPYGEPGMGTIARGGAAFWANVVYSYAILVAATVFLVLRWRGAEGVYRRQSGAVLLGLLVPWLANIVMILGGVTIAGADPTPVTMAISAAAFTVALLRYRMLDLVPVDRHVLIEQLDDGILVLDARGRTSDLNAAAARILHVDPAAAIGSSAQRLLAHEPELSALLAEAGSAGLEIDLATDPGTCIAIRVSGLTDRRGRVIGRLVVLHDVSHRKRLERELAGLATTDALTGVGNRRRFDEQASREMRRIRRTRGALTLVLLDLDHLKQLNDARGHQAGDRALVAVATALTGCVRSVDLVARIGGDEFAVLMPDTEPERAQAVITRVRHALAEAVGDADGSPPLTVSAGIAAAGPDTVTVDDLVAAADAALYEAKQSGRDRAVTAGGS